MQLMVHRGCAYAAHMFSGGFSVLDVRDPRKLHVINYNGASFEPKRTFARRAGGSGSGLKPAQPAFHT
jgi:hypothetical protein